MPKIVEYKMVAGDDSMDLSAKVSDLLRQDWELHGIMSVVDDPTGLYTRTLYQALVRTELTDEERMLREIDRYV